MWVGNIDIIFADVIVRVTAWHIQRFTLIGHPGPSQINPQPPPNFKTPHITIIRLPANPQKCYIKRYTFIRILYIIVNKKNKNKIYIYNNVMYFLFATKYVIFSHI